MKFQTSVVGIFLIVILGSCGIYNKNVLFESEGEIIADSLLHSLSTVEKNYIVQSNDLISIHVSSNSGENLVDPTGELLSNELQTEKLEYLVKTDGTVKLPLIGNIKVSGLNLYELDSMLELKYNKYYNDVFVISKLLNKRVVVIGNLGGGVGGAIMNIGGNVSAQVVKLEYENMNLIEVLAEAGGVDFLAKVNKIKVIRGNLKNPNVYIIDLSTIEGVRKANLLVQPNDIIYVERYGKVVSQILREITPVLTFAGAIVNFALLYILIRDR